MEYILPGFYTSIQILVLICIGFIARKTGIVNQDFQKSVSAFLIKAALPLYFFTKMGRAELSVFRNFIYMPLAAIINVASALFLAFIVFRLLPVSRNERMAGTALGVFGNSGYIPISLIEIFPLTIPLFSSYFDMDKAVIMIGVHIFMYSPLLWSVGNFLITKQTRKFTFRNFISPPVSGILAGLLIPLFHLQDIFFNPEMPFLYIYTAFEKLGTILAPLILVTLGAMIAGIKLHNTVKMNYILMGVIVLRFILLPLVFYILFFLILKPAGFEKILIFVLFLEFHIPPANNFSTMAMSSGANEDLTAYVLLVTYILYIILLPFFLMFFMSVAV